jgi:phenylacetate-CoA ligase
MDARGVSLPELKRYRTVSETVPEGLRERVEDRGAALYDCYSSEEMGYIALQCPESDLYHVMAESLIVEVVDDEGRPCRDGEAGRVLVTDIHNHATPMIRYEIADHAEVGPPCPCGRGLPTLRRILGRERNMIVKPDGTRHWPLTGYKVFREIAPVIQYQFRQHAPDRIEVRLVVERPLTEAEEGALKDAIQTKLRYPFTLDFVYFEGRLPVGSNGKFEEFLRLF